MISKEQIDSIVGLVRSMLEAYNEPEDIIDIKLSSGYDERIEGDWILSDLNRTKTILIQLNGGAQENRIDKCSACKNPAGHEPGDFNCYHPQERVR